MAINVDDLKKLSPKMKALIVFLICLLLGYFYYMFFFQAILAKQMALEYQADGDAAAGCGEGKGGGADRQVYPGGQ